MNLSSYRKNTLRIIIAITAFYSCIRQPVAPTNPTPKYNKLQADGSEDRNAPANLENSAPRDPYLGNSPATSTPPSQTDSLSSKYDYCAKPWDGVYADYTTIDEYRVKTGQPAKKNLDRAQYMTLQGSGLLHDDICHNARVMRKCFDKSIDWDKKNATILIKWSSQNKIVLRALKMAIAWQETGLGRSKDNCYGSGKSTQCNGVGMMQIISASDENGKALSNTDPRWDGITFNVLTNLQYSSRILAGKVSAFSPKSVYELAVKYNGNAAGNTMYIYGRAVEKWYNKILQCGLSP